jgi:plastocyanin
MRRWVQLLLVVGVCVLGAAATAAAAVALATPQAAQQTRLIATVGPDFTITLTHENGSRVTRLEPGAYTITVNDRSEIHNFHLRGPGVNMATGVAFVGTVTWNVTLVEGRYTFVCNPHEFSMAGSFVVGDPPPPPAPMRRLVATVGPGNAIAVRTPAGAIVRQTPPGPYTITVRDRSRLHNFHLIGPGVNRRTTVPFVGTQTWQVQLRAGQLYQFRSIPQAAVVQGSLVVGQPTPPIRRLVATVGPRNTIALRTPAGRNVTTTAPGIYAITVRDLSARHNFHLRGPGVNRMTTVPFRGNQLWHVRLAPGTYAFRSTPQGAALNRTFRVVRP